MGVIIAFLLAASPAQVAALSILILFYAPLCPVRVIHDRSEQGQEEAEQRDHSALTLGDSVT